MIKEFGKWIAFVSGLLGLVVLLASINKFQIDAEGFTKRADVEAISKKEVESIKKDIYYIDKRTERIESGVITIQEILMSKGNQNG